MQKARDARRRDDFRENGRPIKAKELEIKDLINKTLFFGFKESLDAQIKQEFSVQKTAVTLTVSTRSIGFATQTAFSNAYHLFRNIPVCTPWSFYRVTLGQLELKLLNSLHSQVLPTAVGQEDLYSRPQLTSTQKDLIRSAPVNLAPITNTLHAVGNFEHQGKVFYVRPISHPVLGILLSTLRRTVMAMADANTPLAQRQDFYENNPLPYAEWTLPVEEAEGRRRRIPEGAAAGNINHPLLLNADQIMPPDYTDDDLETDIRHYRAFVSHLGRKASSMLSGPCSLDFHGAGQRRQLVSNYMADLRNPYAFRPDVGDYADFPPEGGLEEFWSSEPLDENEMFVGAMNLLGEIPNAALLNRAQATRCDFLAVQRASHRFVTITNNMMG